MASTAGSQYRLEAVGQLLAKHLKINKMDVLKEYVETLEN